jgi:hypothetical protein
MYSDYLSLPTALRVPPLRGRGGFKVTTAVTEPCTSWHEMAHHGTGANVLTSLSAKLQFIGEPDCTKLPRVQYKE